MEEWRRRTLCVSEVSVEMEGMLGRQLDRATSQILLYRAHTKMDSSMDVGVACTIHTQIGASTDNDFSAGAPKPLLASTYT